MAYRSHYLNQYSLTRAAFLPNLWTELTNMGWSLFDGSGIPTVSVPYTDVNITTNTITAASHGFTNGMRIIYRQGTTVIGGLSNNSFYFIVSAATSTFQLSSTQGGGAIDFTSQGSGTHTFEEGFRVYRSNGENSDRVYEYIYIYRVTANTIKFQSYYLWNATTHSGSGSVYINTLGEITTSETGFYTWIYGNKNIVCIHTKVATTYYISGFGHLPKRFWTTLTTTTASATAGSNVVLAVNSTTNFYTNKSYQILGASGEGRDTVSVTAKDSTSLTISSLPRNYGSGSYIGQCPSTFGNFTTTQNTFCMTCPLTAVGTADVPGVSYAPLNTLIDESYGNPDYRGESRYVLQPMLYNDGTPSNSGIFGYIDEYFLNTGTTNKTTEDTIGVGFQDSGLSTGSNTSTTLNDTTKAWTVNAWAPTKVIIITNGTGAGQIRTIASNTSNQITLNTAWVTTPDASSYYSIYDEGYRYFATGVASVFRETM